MRRHSVPTLLMLLFVLSAIPAAGWNPCNRGRSREAIDLTQNLAAETVRGPAKIELKNVNRLRYGVTVSDTITVTPGPDLTSFGFIPSLPTASTPATPNTQAQAGGAAQALALDQDTATSDVDRRVNKLAENLRD